MGFNSVFKGLKCLYIIALRSWQRR